MTQHRKAAWLAALLSPALVGPLWIGLFGLIQPRPFIGTLTGLVAVLLLAVCSVTDLSRRKIPNWATYSAMLWALGVNLTASLVGPQEFLGAVGVGAALMGGAVCFGLMLFVYQFSGGGAGDVKLAAALGWLLGPELGVAALIYSYLVAGALVLAWAVWRLGPVVLVQTLGRKIAAFFLPRFVAAPSAEQLQLLERPIPLALFFALGALPVLLGWDVQW